MRIAVCWKWFTTDAGDARWAGVSPADEAALEVALRIAARTAGATVSVIALAAADADDVLRSAIAAGADDVTRIDAPTSLDGDTVARAVARVAADADLVICGDYSLDRGTGAVPAFIAGELRCAQALGLVEVDVTGPITGGRARPLAGSTPSDTPLDDRPAVDDPDTDDGHDQTDVVRVVRRLDGGRREVLDVGLPAVISVEGSVASLRRASLAATLAAQRTPITVVAGPTSTPRPFETGTYRPRPRVLASPAGGTLDRVRDLLDISGDPRHAETIPLDPPEAADRILEQLAAWGYLD